LYAFHFGGIDLFFVELGWNVGCKWNMFYSSENGMGSGQVLGEQGDDYEPCHANSSLSQSVNANLSF